MKRKLLALVLTAALLLISMLFALPLQAEDSSAEEQTLDERFQDALDLLDRFYDYNEWFMIEKVNDIILRDEEDYFAKVTVPAAEYEALLHRYFVIDETMLARIRSNDEENLTYNAEENTYTCMHFGGFGGSMPERQYWGYVQNENTYDVYYQHITYGYLCDVLPDGVDEWDYAESLGWPESIEYEGHSYRDGMDGYYTILSLDDYGRKYTVEENEDVIRIISCTEDAKIPERSYEFGDATLDGEINMNDVTAVMRHVLKAGELSNTAISLVDVNEDSTVNMDDVTALMRYVLKAETCLKHTWQEATLVAPKTCTVCKKTEGEPLPPSEGLQYEENEEGYTVVGIGSCEDSDIIIPAEYNGKPVTQISGGAFNSAEQIESVIIPDSVKSIGWGAFEYCSNLTSVVISNSIDVISSSLFMYCESLTNVVIPESVTEIEDYAFYGCTSLTDIVIPNGVISIGEYIFGWTGLKTVTIGSGIDGIMTGMFSGCDKLESITLPDNVEYIEDFAFRNCAALKSIIIPDTVCGIGTGSFENCVGLDSTVIGKGVVYIWWSAFGGCTSLKSVVIPKSVTYMYPDVFYDCTSLTDIYVEAETEPDGWDSDWNSDCSAAIHWGDSWHYVDGVPTLK